MRSLPHYKFKVTMTIRITTLDNGLRIATDNVAHAGTVALSAVCGSGARSELQDEHGLAHVLEHMAFKGTARRTAEGIAEEIENVGGDMNAATGVEQTSYDVRVLPRDLGLAVDLLGDILLHPAFDSGELEREKNVIVQEIGAVEDTPDDLVYDLMQNVCFGGGQALGRSILGTPQTVHALNRDDIVRFRDTHYCASNMVVSAAGAIDHDQLVDLVGNHFSTIGGKTTPATSPARWTGGDLRVKRDLEQAHVILAFPGVPLLDDGIYATQVFANIVGGGMSSRLFREVRERRGLAYSVHAFHWAFSDVGLMGVYAGASEGDLPELMRVVRSEMEQAVTDITARELDKAKAQMRMGLELANEQITTRTERLARQLQVFGRPIGDDEIRAKLESVTLAAVMAAGAQMLAQPPSLTAIGPIGTLPESL
jgi:predicted Zn-dependent peptidase